MRIIRRLLWPLAGLALALGLGTAGGAWWYHTSQPDYRLRKGRDALHRGDAQTAEHFALLLEADGRMDHARLLRGEAFFVQAKPRLDAGRPEEVQVPLRRALAEFNKIQDQGDLRVEAAALSGLCLLHLNEPLQAERAFLFVLDHQPDNADAHRGLGAIYYNQGSLTMAVPHLLEVVRLDEHDGRPLRFLGHIYQDLERFGDAIDSFQEALQRNLGSEFAEDAREHLAECQLEQGAHEDALRTLDACHPFREQTPHVTALRAQGLMALGQTEKAKAMLDAALDASPRSVELLAIRARLAWDAHDDVTAASLLEKTLDIDPHNYAAHHLLAQVYQALDRSADAAEHLCRAEETKDRQKALRQLISQADARPWDAEVRLRLANLCREFGRPLDADQWEAAARACGKE
jgi:tetratricopeptide (TPR) repeat protein